MFRRHFVKPYINQNFASTYYKKVFLDDEVEEKIKKQKTATKKHIQQLSKDQKKRYLETMMAKMEEEPSIENQENVDSEQYQEAYEERFMNYLMSMLNALTKRTTTNVNIRVVDNITNMTNMTNNMKKAIPMVKKDVFDDIQQSYNRSISLVQTNINQNDLIDDEIKEFLINCLRFVKYLTQITYFTVKPLDFLFNISSYFTLNSVVTLLYCIYDLLYTIAATYKLRTKQTRRIIQEYQSKKSHTAKRPRYVCLVFKSNITFVSTAVSDLLLTLIEKRVLRCSSLSAVFLLTVNQNVFYKYCLISGKVCLKRINSLSSVRI